jgi:hypothetical protein
LSLHLKLSCHLPLPCSGKTSLCKALSGRLPSNRVWGDISVLVSSSSSSSSSMLGTSASPATAAAGAADGFVGAAGAALLPAADVAHITGFVPQFDLLHESLTVSLTATFEHL